jgi:eukaryotic-like serine/threonine-protein kinase
VKQNMESPQPSGRWQRIEELFYAALDLDTEARPGFLQQACGANLELLQEVESLLDSSRQTFGFARQAVLQVAHQQTTEPQPTGKRVGAYQLITPVGEGGMGTVYLATRADEAYQQQVAIKLMHPGFGPSQGMLLRFSAERQILANLNHPNIARLVDGGMTSDGIPYLVMEYVEGVPIDDYCRQRNLSTDDRLQLFRTVCSAVEYAHKNLVVHRDLKPANILVTAEGIPKLLDFGIAKLLDPQAGTLAVTQASERLMTPEYASPEQMRGDQITTATDVYALGVLLYELLAGRRPFEMQTKSPLEVSQIVCEQVPEPPSRVITVDLGSKAADIARKVKGDLDHIVLMAMRKEPARRYSSVGALSRDLQAYMGGYSVQARTDSWRYRAGKFTRRHKVAFPVGVLAILALIGFSVGIGVLAKRANEQRKIADQQRLAAQREADFLTGVFHAASPEIAKGKPITILDLLDQSAHRIDSELAAAPDAQATLLADLADAYLTIGLNDKAQPLLERAYDIRKKLYGDGDFKVAAIAEQLAHAYRIDGHYPRAEELFRQALQAAEKSPEASRAVVALWTTAFAYCLYEEENRDSEAESWFRKSLVINSTPGDSDVSITRSLLAQVLAREGNLSGALQMANEVSDDLERNEGQSFHLAIARHILAGVLRDMGNLRKAEEVEQGTLALWRKMGGNHIDVVYAMNNLGVILLTEGDWNRAEPLLADALAIRRKHFGPRHPLVATTVLNWGRLLQAKKDYSGAADNFQLSLDVQLETIGRESWRVEAVYDNFARLQLDRRDYPRAESYARQALQLSRKLGGDENPAVATSLTEIALAREFRGDVAGSVPLFREALEILKKRLPPTYPAVISSETRLGEALTADGKADIAEPILRDAVASAHNPPFSLLRWQVAEPENALAACLAKLGHRDAASALAKKSRSGLKSYPESALRIWMLHLTSSTL